MKNIIDLLLYIIFGQFMYIIKIVLKYKLKFG